MAWKWEWTVLHQTLTSRVIFCKNWVIGSSSAKTHHQLALSLQSRCQCKDDAGDSQSPLSLETSIQRFLLSVSLHSPPPRHPISVGAEYAAHMCFSLAKAGTSLWYPWDYLANIWAHFPSPAQHPLQQGAGRQGKPTPQYGDVYPESAAQIPP